jgi:ABC-type Zn uptake system ZnuABC Zn-binding protein ZnuA
VLEVPSGHIDRSQGDIHPAGNPHYWLDPRNGLPIANGMAERLSALSPEDAELFQANLIAFQEQLATRIADWEQRMAPFQGREVVAYHKQWEYLTHWLGLKVIGYVEDKPGVPPSPRHVANLIERMKERRVPVLLCTPFTPPKIPQQVAHKAGANLLLLPPSVTGGSGIETYIDLFEYLISKLESTFKEAAKGDGRE